MRGRSLSFRLAIASVAAVALAVLVFGIAARVVVSDRMHASLDDSLRRRATDVARLAVSAPALLRSPGALESPLSGHQLSVEVLDAEGAIVARSLSLGAKLLPRTSAEATARRGGTAFADAELGGEGIRIFAAPVARAGGPASGGVVLVAGSLADIEGTEHRLGLLLLLCGAGAVAIGGGLAAFLARRGTRPLRDLSSSAATVARTEDPARRLVEPAGPAEVAELASTLNAMLDALAAARERERRLLADASHELRTPLTSLSGNVEFVARHGADPEVVADLEADAARLKLLVDDLLALERESAAPRPREPVRLDELAREAAAGRPAVRVEVDEPLTVSGEPDALARALENLLDNAARYGPPGGAVRLRLRRAGEEAELSVTDGGPGFRPGTEEAAFGRFWRGGDGDAPGSGLGLAIVRATAERHGGRAWAAGSTVTLALPLTSGRTGDVAGRGKAKGTGVRARVRGSVQAVGFREAAVRRARELGVFGWVRNEDDGSVLVQAEGADKAVEAFLGWLGAGPRGAVVDEVEVEKGKVEGHEQFAIRGVSAGVFVVQEHQATAHHWDLRLEVDGVMRSWAVPKGPSMDPAQKRLAVQVEDHQKSHNDFEGRAGEGGVIVWDRGTYEQGGRVPWPEAIERGHAVFVLHGEKLEGGFALQRTRPGEKPQWLLIKRKDDAARPGSDVVAESPESVVSGKTLADVVAAD